jgi:hypothetical protein
LARHHLRNRHARAQVLAQLAERAVGHARHRRHDQIVPQLIRADVHLLCYCANAVSLISGKGVIVIVVSAQEKRFLAISRPVSPPADKRGGRRVNSHAKRVPK